MADIQKFEYEGQIISFEFKDGNKMIHANQMAKPFGKRIDNFLRLKETKTYIAILEARYSHVREREVLRVVQGGTPELQGTCMDEKLALNLPLGSARPLSYGSMTAYRNCLPLAKRSFKDSSQAGSFVVYG